MQLQRLWQRIGQAILDLQTNALPTELQKPDICRTRTQAHGNGFCSSFRRALVHGRGFNFQSQFLELQNLSVVSILPISRILAKVY